MVISPRAGSEAERTTLHTCDELGRRISIGGARTYPLRYEYDLAGRLTALVDGEGNRTEWSFDALGLVAVSGSALSNTLVAVSGSA
jgi:YD repeat-containing protein